MRRLRHIYVKPDAGSMSMRVTLCGDGVALSGENKEPHPLGNINCKACQERMRELAGSGQADRKGLPERDWTVEELAAWVKIF